MPFHRKAGHISEDALQLLHRHIARHRNRIKARAAYCRIRKQRIYREVPFVPAVRQDRIVRVLAASIPNSRLASLELLSARG